MIVETATSNTSADLTLVAEAGFLRPGGLVLAELQQDAREGPLVELPLVAAGKRGDHRLRFLNALGASVQLDGRRQRGRIGERLGFVLDNERPSKIDGEAHHADQDDDADRRHHEREPSPRRSAWPLVMLHRVASLPYRPAPPRGRPPGRQPARPEDGRSACGAPAEPFCNHCRWNWNARPSLRADPAPCSVYLVANRGEMPEKRGAVRDPGAVRVSGRDEVRRGEASGPVRCRSRGAACGRGRCPPVRRACAPRTQCRCSRNISNPRRPSSCGRSRICPRRRRGPRSST